MAVRMLINDLRLVTECRKIYESLRPKDQKPPISRRVDTGVADSSGSRFWAIRVRREGFAEPLFAAGEPASPRFVGFGARAVRRPYLGSR
jgi:hypothetical protein